MKNTSQKFTRREMVEKLLAGMAAGAFFPAIASAQPIRILLKDGAIIDRADTIHHAADWKPLFLSVQQDHTLAELAETIVPGSAKARSNRFIDLLLSVDAKTNQEKFVASLSAMESLSQHKFGRGFPALSPSEKEELLTIASTDPSQQKHFDALKEWISTAYYSSEEGMRDLGWTGEHAFKSSPLCHEGNTVTQ